MKYAGPCSWPSSTVWSSLRLSWRREIAWGTSLSVSFSFLTPDFLYHLLRQSDWLAWEFIENHNMLALRRKLFALRYFWCNVWVASILGSYRPNSGRWSRPVAIHPFSEPCAVDKLLCCVEILWNTLNTLNTLSPWVASRERVSAWTSRPAQPQ